MTVYHKHGGQLGYSGHILNLQQNIQQFINKLPVKAISDLPVLTVLWKGAQNTCHKFRVHRENVLHALQWLKHNNRFYTDIKIDFDTVVQLPTDGILDNLKNLELPKSNNEVMADEGPPTEEIEDNTSNKTPYNSFIPCVQ